MERKDCCCIFIPQQEIMKPIMRRKFLATAATLTAGTAAASALPLQSTEEKKQLVHHVFFWLKNPDSVEDRDKLVEGVKTLAKIESIRKLHVGVLASTEKREVVDTSWQVSELMFFDDVIIVIINRGYTNQSCLFSPAHHQLVDVIAGFVFPYQYTIFDHVAEILFGFFINQ